MLCPLPKPSSTTSPRKPSQVRARRVLRPPSSPAAATSRGVTWVDQKFIRRTYASGGRAEAEGVALWGLLALDLTVLGRCGGGGVLEQVRCRVRHRLDRLVERGLVGQAGLRAPADLADVLEGGGLHLLRRGGGLEVVELSDVAAHASTLGRHARAHTSSRSR